MGISRGNKSSARFFGFRGPNFPLADAREIEIWLGKGIASAFFPFVGRQCEFLVLLGTRQTETLCRRIASILRDFLVNLRDKANVPDD